VPGSVGPRDPKAIGLTLDPIDRCIVVVCLSMDSLAGWASEVIRPLTERVIGLTGTYPHVDRGGGLSSRSPARALSLWRTLWPPEWAEHLSSRAPARFLQFIQLISPQWRCPWIISMKRSMAAK